MWVAAFGWPAEAAEPGGAMSQTCRAAPDGSIACVRISGYLSAGSVFVRSDRPGSPPFSDARPSGFATGAEMQDNALGPTRLYLGSGPANGDDR